MRDMAKAGPQKARRASPKGARQAKEGRPAPRAGRCSARIYNLFPLLAGPIDSWSEHLPRIAAMGFDWVFVNPFHFPGFSGSLYAIKDHERLHPVVQGTSTAPAEDLIRDFVRAARRHGLSVMFDLVINHTAKDALLVDEHPEWYLREIDGTLRSPRTRDPDDARKVTLWGDLAELDYAQPKLHAEQTAYWAELIGLYLDMGVTGFRCDAAYQVPAEIWYSLIATARAAEPAVLFAAETLGCTPAQVLALSDAGFDLMFNSSKYWDFRAPWLLEQYELYRQVAPTAAFPESHDTERLVQDLDGADPEEVERSYRLRYLFAAAFSSAVMMPMGYEYGFAKQLHVIDTRPEDWTREATDPRFDLTEFVGAVNRMKAGLPALNVEGPQRRVSAPHAPLVALLRLDRPDARIAEQAVITVVNPDPAGEQGLDPAPLFAEAGGRFGTFRDVTPEAEAVRFEPGCDLSLAPFEIRIFAAEAEAPAGKAVPEKAAQKRLEKLAADRVAIEAVEPEIDGGRHAVKRVVGDVLEVSADIFCDGHEKISACVRYREWNERRWREVPMAHVDNDRWMGRVPLTHNARYVYTVEAWRDLFQTWRADLIKKHDAGLDLSLELIEGTRLLEKTRDRAVAQDKKALQAILARLAEAGVDQGQVLAVMLSEDLQTVMGRAVERSNLSRYERELEVFVDRPAARFAAWYEMFPRSQSGDASRHGTFRDVIESLPYVRDMGFDVLYFTPIHPIGRTARKGRNNSLTAAPDDPGSPYAIGAAEGGHDALHPELGTWEDFAALVEAAYGHGLELALDFAIQCSRDHPWLEEHPEWFDWRPDGTIKFAENPPKKYEDIVNVHFYRDAIPSIWYELRDNVLFWIDKGVKIFRVDNPHTKPLPFWEWMIRDVLDRHPDVIFLAEAFTRPKMMKRLAKVGFTQSYTYFTWRNTKAELTEYLIELTQDEPKDFYRPNFFANTPDINPEILQTGGPAAFKIRVMLASTLSSVYGIYNGFELCEGRPIPGKEEYLNSEKYEIKAWDYDRLGNIRDYVTRLNQIRRDNPALHQLTNLRFYNAWDDNVMVYGKMTPAKDNVILVAVNVYPFQAHGAHFEVPLWEFGLPDDASVEVEDLLTGQRFVWHGKVQHVWLDPQIEPCAIWRITPPGLSFDARRSKLLSSGSDT